MDFEAIKRRHADANIFESYGMDGAEWRAEMTMLATRAHADRAALIARVEELTEALEEIAAHYNGGITGPGRQQADSMRNIAQVAIGWKEP